MLESSSEEDAMKKEEASQKEVSCSKKETTKDMMVRWSEGAKCAPRMSRFGGSSAPRVLLHLNILLYIYV
jgi:hypothetical protein